MSDTIIRVENLGKKYLIKHQQRGSYTALRDVITDKVKSFGKRIISPWNHKQSSTYSTTEEFWALKDISFKVKQGEVVGIIGRNGAGKSTLLKILSRITEPTKGRIRINGRVASLLEVGTGFHPELTGRENIFLNGAILGMGKAEIKRKFDEIVAFAEIEKFLDTPVKRYSSGMYVRLAFAVAAHLEPEILLVDEVLAVGDAQFQKKCLGKMGDIAQEGRTLLFVSHNMGAITNLCSRTVHIHDGKIEAAGPSEDIVANYINLMTQKTAASYLCEKEKNLSAWILSAELKKEDGEKSESFLMTEPIMFECIIKVTEESVLTLSLQIKELNNSPIYHFPNGDSDFAMPSVPGRYQIRVSLPPLNLFPGRYLIKLSLCNSFGSHFAPIHIIDTLSFNIQQDYTLCARQLVRHAGLIFSKVEWSACELPNK